MVESKEDADLVASGGPAPSEEVRESEVLLDSETGTIRLELLMFQLD